MLKHKNSSTPDTPPRARPAPPQETLVHDARAGLTPAQMVERKLVALLGNSILPASHLQASRMRRTLS